MACGGGYNANLILSNGWKSIPYVCSACGGRIMFQTCLLVSNGWKSILCVYTVCGGGYDPNLIVSNGWQTSLWEGYSPILISSNGWKSIVGVCTTFGGGCGPDLDLIVSNFWKSIQCVCMACRGRVRSKPDCVKWLEINSMSVHGMWRRVPYKPDCFKWLEINHLSAWYVKEGTFQTWLCQIAGNQCLCVCIACRRRVRSKPDCVKCLEIIPMCVWLVDKGMVQTRLCQMAGNQFTPCEGGYGTNLIVSNGKKPIICVHGMWRRVPSKPDCVKWLEIKPICVHSMLHVLYKIKLLLLWCETCNMTSHVFNEKKCYLSIDMFIYSRFAELKLLFIHIFYSVKHLKNIYSSLLFSLLAVNYNYVLRTNSELILTMWNNIRSI